jgi:ribulose-5-phosphate 4-epimerase/fuculose-1-phosphate aldolase
MITVDSMNDIDQKKKNLLLIIRVLEDYLGVHDANRTHNSVRLSENMFSVNPFNSRITKGLKLEHLTDLSYNEDADVFGREIPPMIYRTHKAYYNNSDLNYFIHFHDPAVIAVANRDEGLKKLSQDSLMIHRHVYHKKYTGLFDNHLTHDFTDLYKNTGKTVVLIQGHGGLVMAKTAEDALLKSYMLVRSCRIQVLDLNSNIDMPDDQFTDELNAIVGQSMYHSFMNYYENTL